MKLLHLPLRPPAQPFCSSSQGSSRQQCSTVAACRQPQAGCGSGSSGASATARGAAAAATAHRRRLSVQCASKKRGGGGGGGGQQRAQQAAAKQREQQVQQAAPPPGGDGGAAGAKVIAGGLQGIDLNNLQLELRGNEVVFMLKEPSAADASSSSGEEGEEGGLPVSAAARRSLLPLAAGLQACRLAGSSRCTAPSFSPALCSSMLVFCSGARRMLWTPWSRSTAPTPSPTTRCERALLHTLLHAAAGLAAAGC